MALITEIWVQDVQNSLNQNADFLPYSTDHSAYIAFGTVHVPQSGVNPTALVNPSSFPLAIGQRVDTDLTYSLNQYALTPTLISNLDELQVSYDKRQSVIGQQMSTLTEVIGNVVANSWSASGSANIVRTTGATGGSLAPSATGARKLVTLVDIANLAKKLDKDNVPSKGRKLLMNADMFWELFTISEVVRASYNGFQINALASGVVAQLFGFDIMVRPTSAIYDNTATPVLKALTAGYYTGAAADNLACIAWHPSYVSRALGSMSPMYDSGSNGNGKPEYLGSIFNMEVMLGSAKLRTDLKGVVALVQAHA